MSRQIELDGASVAITGAARGIGFATAKLFASHGARVAVGDLDEKNAMAAAKKVGNGATGYALDVADKESYAAFLKAAEAAHGDLDILVNNAGIMPNGAFLDLDDQTDRLQFDVNVFGVINGMKLALPCMIERGRGHVVNVASLAGKFPIRGLAVYNATKFAVVGLSCSDETRARGHRSNADHGPSLCGRHSPGFGSQHGAAPEGQARSHRQGRGEQRSPAEGRSCRAVRTSASSRHSARSPLSHCCVRSDTCCATIVRSAATPKRGPPTGPSSKTGRVDDIATRESSSSVPE